MPVNLVRPSHGQARVLGVDTQALGLTQFQRIGYVSENQQLPEWMTTEQWLGYCRPFYPTWDPGLAKSLKAQLGLDGGASVTRLP